MASKAANRRRGDRAQARLAEEALLKPKKQPATEQQAANLEKGRSKPGGGWPRWSLRDERGHLMRKLWELTESDIADFEAFQSKAFRELGYTGFDDPKMSFAHSAFLNSLFDAWLLMRTTRNVIRRKGVVTGKQKGEVVNEFTGLYMRAQDRFDRLMQRLFPLPKLPNGGAGGDDTPDETDFDRIQRGVNGDRAQTGGTPER